MFVPNEVHMIETLEKLFNKLFLTIQNRFYSLVREILKNSISGSSNNVGNVKFNNNILVVNGY